MKYIVNGRRRFSTLEDALACAARIHRRTGVFVSVEAL